MADESNIPSDQNSIKENNDVAKASEEYIEPSETPKQEIKEFDVDNELKVKSMNINTKNREDAIIEEADEVETLILNDENDSPAENNTALNEAQPESIKKDDAQRDHIETVQNETLPENIIETTKSNQIAEEEIKPDTLTRYSSKSNDPNKLNGKENTIENSDINDSKINKLNDEFENGSQMETKPQKKKLYDPFTYEFLVQHSEALLNKITDGETVPNELVELQTILEGVRTGVEFDRLIPEPILEYILRTIEGNTYADLPELINDDDEEAEFLNTPLTSLTLDRILRRPPPLPAAKIVDMDAMPTPLGNEETAYLKKTVLDALTEGLMDVCVKRPRDPVIHLSVYLRTYAAEIRDKNIKMEQLMAEKIRDQEKEWDRKVRTEVFQFLRQKEIMAENERARKAEAARLREELKQRKIEEKLRREEEERLRLEEEARLLAEEEERLRREAEEAELEGAEEGERVIPDTIGEEAGRTSMETPVEGDTDLETPAGTTPGLPEDDNE